MGGQVTLSTPAAVAVVVAVAAAFLSAGWLLHWMVRPDAPSDGRHLAAPHGDSARVQQAIHAGYNRLGPPSSPSGPLDVLAEYGRLLMANPSADPPLVERGPVYGHGQPVQWPLHNPRYDTAAPTEAYAGLHRPQWPVLDLRFERQHDDTGEQPCVH